MDPTLDTITQSIKDGKRKIAKQATADALAAKLPPEDILNALMAGMDDVGRRFKANELFVPEVLVAARAMKASMDLLEPELAASGISPKYTAVIGTVEGDLHDIGKNLVAMMLKGANFKVVDLGTNVSTETFIEAVRENKAQLLCLSALLTTTMPAMRATAAKAKEADLPVHVLVGGAPINAQFAQDIGADGFAPDAASAVDEARRLVAAG